VCGVRAPVADKVQTTIYNMNMQISTRDPYTCVCVCECIRNGYDYRRETILYIYIYIYESLYIHAGPDEVNAGTNRSAPNQRENIRRFTNPTIRDARFAYFVTFIVNRTRANTETDTGNSGSSLYRSVFTARAFRSRPEYVRHSASVFHFWYRSRERRISFIRLGFAENARPGIAKYSVPGETTFVRSAGGRTSGTAFSERNFGRGGAPLEFRTI